VNWESSPSAVRKAILLFTVGVCALGSGCRGGEKTWSAEARSPDKLWLASAHTVENSGFGTGAVITIVDLKGTNVSNPPETILSFWHDPSLASQSGATINLTMKWATPTHLEVTYNGHAELGFQVVKYGGIDISVRDLSGKPTTTSQKAQQMDSASANRGQIIERDAATILSEEAQSPDGLWLATARSQQSGGPGPAYGSTTVYLKWVKGSQPPRQVLEFSHQYSRMNLTMQWVTPTHLVVTYGASARPDGHVSLNFQAVKCANVDISVRDLSSEAINTTQ